MAAPPATHTRSVLLPGGARCRVPRHVQRIDVRSTHGWQLRLGQPTRFFSDSLFGGPRPALAAAVKALRQRLREQPAPTGLHRVASRGKQNGLPAGISGPILRRRADRRSHECHFSVLLPRWGAPPKRRSVYIANERTWSADKYHDALDRAILLRAEAEALCQIAADTAARATARRLRPAAVAR
ncbi:MAG: hypothetical protein ACKVQR_00015 [Aquabacterium sp.]